MSLGSSYWQKEDDLSAASANAVNLGVVVVSSAGNSADRPYIVGSPSTTPEVISVAATFHPTAKMYLVQTPTVAPVGAVWQSWSAAPSLVSGPLVYDTTSASTRRGCVDAAGTNPWTGTQFPGKILLIDRGICAVSMKVANAGAAGAIAAIVANNVRSEEHTSELQSLRHLVCRLLLEKKKKKKNKINKLKQKENNLTRDTQHHK